MYEVRYWIEDEIVFKEKEEDLETALETAMEMDCKDYNDYEYESEDGLDESESASFLTEVWDTKTNCSLFWCNTEGDQGSDYEEDDEISDMIANVMSR